MHFSTAIVIAPLAASIVGAMPAMHNKRQVDTQSISDAIFAWQADTQDVSNFLSTATSITDPGQFTSAAQDALDHEKDELLHKAVLDGVLQGVNSVVAANFTLVNNGAFGFVVDSLQDMVNTGPSQATTFVENINVDRCIQVLPAIDAYFAAAADLIGLSPAPTAVRPDNCPDFTPAARR